MEIEFSVPITVVSPLNERKHWRASHGLKKLQRDTSKLLLMSLLNRNSLGKRIAAASKIRVVFTRFYAMPQHKMDSDNLKSAFKHIRDGVALAIGIDDGSDIYDWDENQKIGDEFGVKVKIEWQE